MHGQCHVCQVHCSHKSYLTLKLQETIWRLLRWRMGCKHHLAHLASCIHVPQDVNVSASLAHLELPAVLNHIANDSSSSRFSQISHWVESQVAPYSLHACKTLTCQAISEFLPRLQNHQWLDLHSFCWKFRLELWKGLPQTIFGQLILQCFLKVKIFSNCSKLTWKVKHVLIISCKSMWKRVSSPTRKAESFFRLALGSPDSSTSIMSVGTTACTRTKGPKTGGRKPRLLMEGALQLQFRLESNLELELLKRVLLIHLEGLHTFHHQWLGLQHHLVPKPWSSVAL